MFRQAKMSTEEAVDEYVEYVDEKPADRINEPLQGCPEETYSNQLHRRHHSHVALREHHSSASEQISSFSWCTYSPSVVC